MLFHGQASFQPITLGHIEELLLTRVALESSNERRKLHNVLPLKTTCCLHQSKGLINDNNHPNPYF